jgi:AcrR family transcriptional regulator
LTIPERDTRQSIVDTAERFFRDIGYQKTTVADIAKSLRMSPANVYRFFDSKKSINEAVLARYKGELEEAMAAIAAEQRSAGSRLRDILVLVYRVNSARFADQVRMQEMVCAAMEDPRAYQPLRRPVAPCRGRRRRERRIPRHRS